MTEQIGTYNDIVRTIYPEFQARIMEPAGAITLRDVEKFRDAYNLPTPRSEFFRLLNLGSVSE